MKVLRFIKNKYVFLIIMMVSYQEVFKLDKIHTFTIFICFQTEFIKNEAKKILNIDLRIHQKCNMNPWILFTEMPSNSTQNGCLASPRCTRQYCKPFITLDAIDQMPERLLVF